LIFEVTRALSIGIDESNHGRFPEIFVAVRTYRKSDIKPKDGLSKCRENGEIYAILEGRDFRYITVSSEMGAELSLDETKVLVFSSFIRYFDAATRNPLSRVIIDGYVEDRLFEDVGRLIYPISLPLIIAETKADKIYPIVNVADRVANLLHRHHHNKRNEKLAQYAGKRLDLSLEDYLGLLRAEKN
tara:strand:+ start:427 stop:987 length:561 start_codon:yes stop_codon:yes gene_type:complete